jgi:hypothetical protein
MAEPTLSSFISSFLGPVQVSSEGRKVLDLHRIATRSLLVISYIIYFVFISGPATHIGRCFLEAPVLSALESDR